MAGDGGDATPQQTVGDGKFLLQLLQRRPHHLHRPQAPQQPQPPPYHGLFDAPSVPSPPQSLAYDPAVAAVGPSLSFPTPPSNGHDLASQPWSHAVSSPYLPHLVGFPQNPPWVSLPPGFPGSDGLGLQSPLDRRLTDEEKLGLLGVKIRGNSANPQGAQKLMFGSFPCDIGSQEGLSNGDSVLASDRDGLFSTLNASREREMDVGYRGFDGSARDRYFESPPVHTLNAFGRSGSGYRQQMPPGFSKKLDSDPRGRGRGFENNMDEVNHRGFSSNGEHETLRKTTEQVKMQNVSAEARLRELLGRPAPRSGTNLRSTSSSDVDDSLVDGCSEDKRRRGGGSGQARRGLDDLSERIVDFGLDDGWDEKNDSKQRPTREKEVRSYARGQIPLSQEERKFKRHMECRDDIRKLNAPFLAIYESLIPLEEEKDKQKKLMTLLKELVYEEWPNAQLYLYGSCENSFGLSKSDVDVCLAIKDADIDKSEVLLRLADILRSNNLQNVQALTRARVPIVKLMDPETGLSCDICINNILAVVNTKLLRDYAQIDVRLRQLAFIVKHWAKSRGVNETYQGTLSSYAYILMCIHFLQKRRPAILPCLQGMKATYFETVDEVQCAFFDQVDSLRNFGFTNTESIAQLVWAFFNYWAYCHDYTNGVISVRTGNMISKRAKDWTRRIGNDRHLICIEDPFEVSHDLGRVVDKYSIEVLRREFERAAHIMQFDPNPCVALFEPYTPL